MRQLYRRGANRVQFQMRQCSSTLCADNPNWWGPDGSNQTYFSEMDFGTGGTTPGLSPLNNYTTAAPALNTSPNAPYVHYLAFLQSDDPYPQCAYAGQAAPCSPELTAVSLFRTNYPSSSPALTMSSGASLYYALSSFAQTLGGTGCSAGVTYTLSPDGTNKYYYNGSAWVTANGSAAQSTAAGQLNAAAINAYSTLMGPQSQTFFNAFLASDSNTPCSL